MANVLDLRRRIRSVKSTRQITKAMKMIAAAKLRRAQERAISGRPYANMLASVIGSLMRHTDLYDPETGDVRHPLLLAREEKQALLTRAIRAIRAAEETFERGKPADPAILKKIIEVVNMQDSIELMKKYYSEEAWERRRRYYENGPGPEWLGCCWPPRAARRAARSWPASCGTATAPAACCRPDGSPAARNWPAGCGESAAELPP